MLSLTKTLLELYLGSSESFFQVGLDFGPCPVLGLPSQVLAKNPAKSSPHPCFLIKFLIAHL